MANELCAFGFGNDIDGQYHLAYKDHWTNDKYWIYRDSFYWMISDSEFLYEYTRVLAVKRYMNGQTTTWANGEYYAPEVKEGTIGYYLPEPLPPPIGRVDLGECP